MDAKRLKKLLAEDPTPLPPELEWERMEAGIEKKMAGLQNTESTPKSAAKHRKWYLLGLALLLLIPVLCSRLISSRSAEPTIDSPFGIGIQQSAFPLWPDEAVQPGIALANDRSEGDHSIHDRQQGQPTVSPEHSRNGSATATLTDEGPAIPANDTAAASTADTSNSQTATSRPNRFVPNTATPASRAPITTPAPLQRTSTAQPSTQLRTATAVAPLPSSFSLLPVTARSVPAPPPYSFSLAPRATLPAFRQLDLSGGLTGWRPGYGDQRPERHPYEKPIASLYAALDYTRSLGRRFTWSVGLQYQQLEHRFDWSTEIADYPVTIPDTILRVRTNSLTGQQTVQRGDVTLTAPARRTVRHYNKIQLIQIPLTVGKIWESPSWRSEVAFGGTLSVYTRQQGRTLYQEEIIDYSGPQTDFLTTRWRVSALLRGRLTYRLSRRIGLTASVQAQQFLSNWSTEDNTVSRPVLISAGLGVNYRF